MRERERGGETDRQTDRQRQRDRQTDREGRVWKGRESGDEWETLFLYYYFLFESINQKKLQMHFFFSFFSLFFRSTKILSQNKKQERNKG